MTDHLWDLAALALSVGAVVGAPVLLSYLLDALSQASYRRKLRAWQEANGLSTATSGTRAR